MKRALSACLVLASLAPGAFAPAFGEEAGKGSYEAALDCAGRFKWLLDASAGGQPPLNGYTLDQRVKAATRLEARVRELAPAAGVSSGAVAGAILDIADATTELFFSDPDKVEGMLTTCRPMAGIE